jgi:hypothetical protein
MIVLRISYSLGTNGWAIGDADSSRHARAPVPDLIGDDPGIHRNKAAGEGSPFLYVGEAIVAHAIVLSAWLMMKILHGSQMGSSPLHCEKHA